MSVDLKLEIARTDAMIAGLLAELRIDPTQCDFLWTCQSCSTINLVTLHNKSCFVCHAARAAVAAPKLDAPQPVAQKQTSKFYAPAVLDNVAPQAASVSTFPKRDDRQTNAEEETVCWQCPACMSCKPSADAQCSICFFDTAQQETTHCQACYSSLGNQGVCQTCGFAPTQDLQGWKCGACQTFNSSVGGEQCHICFADHDHEVPLSQQQCQACTSAKPQGEECPVCLFNEADAGSHCPACTSALAPGQTSCPVCSYDLVPVKAMARSIMESTLDLSLDDKRESLNRPRTEELLAGRAHGGIRTLRLSSKSFGRDASIVAAQYLVEHMTQVEHADFSDIIAGRPTDEALEVLRLVCSSLNPNTLKLIDLSDNALGERGIRTLEPFLLSIASTVESVSFRNDGLSELSIKLLVDYFQHSANKLTALHFESNMSGDGGAKFLAPLFTQLAKFPQLPFDFSMVSCRVRSEGSASLNQSLGSIAGRLNALDLSDCMMGDLGSEQLVQLLKQTPNLTKLLLKDTGITKKAMGAVIECIRGMPNLRVLDLSVLEMNSSDMNALFTILNENKNSQLEQLNLAENNGKLKGISGLFVTPKVCPKLSIIDLSMNQLDDAAAGMILGRIDKRELKQVELNGNMFSAGVVEVLQHKLRGVIGSLDENEEP